MHLCTRVIVFDTLKRARKLLFLTRVRAHCRRASDVPMMRLIVAITAKIEFPLFVGGNRKRGILCVIRYQTIVLCV